MIGIEPVGDVDGAAEIAKQRGLAQCGRGAGRGKDRMTFHFLRNRHTEQVEEGRRQIDRLRQRRGSRAGARIPGIVNEQRNMHDLLIEIHAVLGPEIMLAKQKTVIGRHHQRGVLPQIVTVEIIEQLAEQKIAQRDHGVIIGAQLLAFGRQFVDAAVSRPVADRTVPPGIERRLEARGRVERLMRIEGLDLEQPVVRLAVAIEEVEAVSKALHRRKVFFLLDEFTVDDVL